jgi:hypothetical protein
MDGCVYCGRCAEYNLDWPECEIDVLGLEGPEDCSLYRMFEFQDWRSDAFRGRMRIRRRDEADTVTLPQEALSRL